VTTLAPRKRLWFFWAAGLAWLLGLTLFPVGNRWTRSVSLLLALGLWIGLLVLLWRQRVLRWTLFALALVTCAFLVLPARNRPDLLQLRRDYVACLRRYQGVKYCWGGDNFLGMDGAGLVRRAMVDMLFYRGICSFRANLVRNGLYLWWTGCTAGELGRGFMTIHQWDTPSLNSLEHARVRPGDLAVCLGQDQVLAYLGDHVWMVADPSAKKVILATAPSAQNEWFRKPMKILRWRILDR
jgi:hypothetical protein